VELLANERAAAAVVAADGVTVASAPGTKKPHPAIRSLEIARSQAVPLLKQFGLLPAAPRRSRRERPELPVPNGKSSIWDGVLTP
jgi:phage terminase small subunit